MTPETKRFLILWAGVALIGWIGGNWLLGPPGLSSAYLEQYGDEHEHYVESIKNPAFKVYEQRPGLVNLDLDPELQQGVAFVEAYRSGEAYQAEQHRIELYTLFFEFFNAGLVVVLVLRLGKAPLYGFLDAQIAALQEKMNQAARSKKSALARRAAVEEKIADLPQVEMKIHDETERRIERELQELATANHYSLGLQERELAERKHAAYHNAELAIRHRLVTEAIDTLLASVHQESSDARQAALIEEFARALEARQV